MQGLSLVAASGGHSSLRCAGLSLSQPLLLWSTGYSFAGSVVVAHGPSCSMACGIFPGQGSNPCPLHWQADSQPLRHQGSPKHNFYMYEETQKFVWLALLWSSGTEPAISLRYACIFAKCLFFLKHYRLLYKCNLHTNGILLHHPSASCHFLCTINF